LDAIIVAASHPRPLCLFATCPQVAFGVPVPLASRHGKENDPGRFSGLAALRSVFLVIEITPADPYFRYGQSIQVGTCPRCLGEISQIERSSFFRCNGWYGSMKSKRWHSVYENCERGPLERVLVFDSYGSAVERGFCVDCPWRWLASHPERIRTTSPRISNTAHPKSSLLSCLVPFNSDSPSPLWSGVQFPPLAPLIA
jgi:hypothetical protein